MTMLARLVPALLLCACASTAAPLPSLHATQVAASKPCSSCSSAESCSPNGLIRSKSRLSQLAESPRSQLSEPPRSQLSRLSEPQLSRLSEPQLSQLSEPQRPSLRARPSWSGGPRGGHIGLVLDLRF